MASLQRILTVDVLAIDDNKLLCDNNLIGLQALELVEPSGSGAFFEFGWVLAILRC